LKVIFWLTSPKYGPFAFATGGSFGLVVFGKTLKLVDTSADHSPSLSFTLK